MRTLLENFCVYHVTAPGQEEGAPSLPEEYVPYRFLYLVLFFSYFLSTLKYRNIYIDLDRMLSSRFNNAPSHYAE